MPIHLLRPLSRCGGAGGVGPFSCAFLKTVSNTNCAANSKKIGSRPVSWYLSFEKAERYRLIGTTLPSLLQNGVRTFDVSFLFFHLLPRSERADATRNRRYVPVLPRDDGTSTTIRHGDVVGSGCKRFTVEEEGPELQRRDKVVETEARLAYSKAVT